MERIRRAVSPRRDRERENRSLFARGAGDLGARKNGTRAGAGDCVAAMDWAAVPVVVWRAVRGRGGAALGAERCGTSAGMVARAERRGARRCRDALGGVCAAGKYR